MLTFKQKLVLSMMAVVGGITLALLAIAERKLQSAHAARFQSEFDSEFALFAARQEAQLGSLKSAAGELSTSVRFIAALTEVARERDLETAQLAYEVIQTQLDTPGGPGVGKIGFYRAYDAGGQLIDADRSAEARAIDAQLESIRPAIASLRGTEIGYLNLRESGGATNLYQILLSRCYDEEEEALKGVLLFGAPFQPPPQSGGALFGLWVEGRLQVAGVPQTIQDAIRDRLRQGSGNRLRAGGRDYAYFQRPVNGQSGFPQAYHVSLQPLDSLEAEKRDLRRRIAIAGALAFAVALGISQLLAGSLTAPIERLVEGTREVSKGNFDLKLPVRTRDEIGQLTAAFNEMAAGLLLREKYRSVLDMVSDKRIAEDLIHGQIELGGEERMVSVLFCDIRGFTALTEKMEPKEVIQMLNEHFTPLTRIVHEHHGAVDKFVGDLIMAIFGAPKSAGDDVEHAARCALRMIEERARLNQTGRYQIAIGIGVASGQVVAGRMGSKDRLNYTVLGPRVNLASRLCSQAGRMEVVIDAETWRSIEDRAQAVPTPELRLKGFAQPVQAYKLQSIAPNHETEKNLPVGS